MKNLFATLLAATLLTIGATSLSAETTPKSVIHMVTVKWKDGTTPEQIQAALDGVKALPAAFPGITHVWIKSIKVQSAKGVEKPRTHAFVMEFADEAALKAYTDSPAQKEWYKTYLPIRDESTTFDITN
jgi:uncharacterized protein (DUF1330 family)